MTVMCVRTSHQRKTSATILHSVSECVCVCYCPAALQLSLPFSDGDWVWAFCVTRGQRWRIASIRLTCSASTWARLTGKCCGGAWGVSGQVFQNPALEWNMASRWHCAASGSLEHSGYWLTAWAHSRRFIHIIIIIKYSVFFSIFLNCTVVGLQ